MVWIISSNLQSLLFYRWGSCDYVIYIRSHYYSLMESALTTIYFSNAMKALALLWTGCQRWKLFLKVPARSEFLLQNILFRTSKKVIKNLKFEEVCCFMSLLGVLPQSYTWSFRVNTSAWDQFNFKISFSISRRDDDPKVPICLVRNGFKKARRGGREGRRRKREREQEGGKGRERKGEIYKRH